MIDRWNFDGYDFYCTYPNQLTMYLGLEDDATQRNKAVSFNAIQRAVAESNMGNYDTAIDTLRAAISLVKQSSSDNSQGTHMVLESLYERMKDIEKRSHSGRGNSSSRCVFMSKI